MADGGIEDVAVDAEGHSPFKDVKNFSFGMDVQRCCCAWGSDIFHNCIAAIHLCSVNPNTQLLSGDCLKPFDSAPSLRLGIRPVYAGVYASKQFSRSLDVAKLKNRTHRGTC